MRPTVGLLLSLAAGSAAVACGPTAPRSGQPSWRRPEMASAGSNGPIRIELAPAGRSARFYNARAEVAAPRSALSDALLVEIKRVSAEIGKPAPRPDGRLYAAVRELAEVVPEDSRLVYSLIEFALQRNGIMEPSPHLIVMRGPASDEDVVADVRARLPTILRSADFARVGLGVALDEDGQDVIVLAFQSSFLRTTPIPRRLEAGERVSIDATLVAPFIDPEVFVTREDGNVERLVLRARGKDGFRSELACGNHRGRQQVEVTALDQSGATVMANFPVWCGEDPPASIAVELDAEELAPVVSAEEAEKRLERLVNRDREKHGLAPLALDPRLEAVARAHSHQMRATGVVAHVSTTTGSAGDRVKAGKIKTSLVLENVARAYGVGEAEEGLMNSPGHRANILSRDATHMGLGITLGGDVAGQRELFVTQLFIRLPPPIDYQQVRQQIADAVRKKRVLDEDRELSLVAQELAEGVAGGQTPADASKNAGVRLGVLRLPYGKITTQITTLADVASFEADAALAAKTLAAYGLGVAQGDHEVMGEHAITVVLLFAHR